MSSVLETPLGKAIASARKRQGWRQAELAKRLEVGQQSVSRWERGTSRPEAPVLKKLAAIFREHSLDEWRSLAGYGSVATNGEYEGIKHVRPPLLIELPLSLLSPKQFEEFCGDLIQAEHPEAAVNLFGGHGDKQDGVDIEATFRDGSRHVYQCKRTKTFGPQKVKAAVNELKSQADRAYLLLSRAATTPTRKEINKYADWELWDSEDIARRVRQLQKDQACRLVDTYFPGLRQDFLGIPNPSPFLDPDQYFAPFLKRTIFSHAWSLIGRIEVVKRLCAMLTEDSRSIVVLYGSGGIGKSRTVRAVCESFQKVNRRVAVRIVDAGATITPNDFDLLRGQETLLIIDDAHDRSDLDVIFGLITRSQEPIRTLVVTRPYALSLIKVELARTCLFPRDEAVVHLEKLSRSEVEELSKEVLTTLNGKVSAAPEIAQLTADSPLATVVGSYLVATKLIQPTTLASENDFRQQLYKSFEEVITGEIAKAEDRDTVRDVLGFLSLVQPVNPENPAFREAAINAIGKPIDKILRVFTRLQEGGVLLRRGRSLRIVPDLLGEYILEERCVFPSLRMPSGLAERVVENLGEDLLRNLLVNIARLDWRVSKSTNEMTSIIDPLWKTLIERYEQNKSERLTIVRAVSDVAYYQPERALQFADLVISERDGYVREIPELLKHVAYNYEFVADACDRLWRLGKNDVRPLNQRPEHPIRILSELASITPNKPLEYCEAVVDFAIRGLHESEPVEHAYSLFEILEAALNTEGHTTQSRGYSITFRPFFVRFEAVKKLRQKVIAIVFSHIRDGYSSSAVRAARCLHQALRKPMGYLGARLDEQQDDLWAAEFRDTLNKIKDVFVSEDIDPVVTVELQKAIDWHVKHGGEKTRRPAVEAVKAIRKTLEYRVTLSLLDGWGYLREGVDDDLEKAQKQLELEMQAVARDLFDSYSTSDQVRKALEERYSKIYRLCGTSGINSYKFIRILIQQKSELGKSIWLTALTEGNSYPLLQTLSVILSIVMEKDPQFALDVSIKALALGQASLSREVAFGYGGSCGGGRELTDRELDFIATLFSHDDGGTVAGIIRALGCVAKQDKKRAIDLLLSIDFERYENSERLIHEAFMNVVSKENQLIEFLSKELIDKILERLIAISSIADYWLTNFLVKISKRYPDEVFEFLLKRIDHELNQKQNQYSDYDSVPWHWDDGAKLTFRDQSKFERYVSAIIHWLKDKDAWISSERSATLFATICRKYDEVTIEALEPFLLSFDPLEVRAASNLLKRAPNTFVHENCLLVQKVLEHARRLGRETLKSVEGDLFSSVISGVRSGTPGEPFPEDIQLRDESWKIMLQLPANSPAQKFYTGLKRYAENQIRRSHEEQMDIEGFEDD